MNKTHVEIIHNFLRFRLDDFIDCFSIPVDLSSALAEMLTGDLNVLHIKSVTIMIVKLPIMNVIKTRLAPLEIQFWQYEGCGLCGGL